MKSVDVDEIEHALALLWRPGDVREVRAPKCGRDGTISGYFDAPRRAAEAVAALDERGVAAGIYVTLSPVQPALLARSNNRLQSRAATTTGDADIIRRRWLLVDCDPERPAGISSTDEEHELAIARAYDVREYLTATGWPAPIVVDSGNGAHLWYGVDLPCDDDATTIVGRALAGLNHLFGDARVKIDRSVGNAARIAKIPGTMTRKGDDMPDRPHRRARILLAASDRVIA